MLRIKTEWTRRRTQLASRVRTILTAASVLAMATGVAGPSPAMAIGTVIEQPRQVAIPASATVAADRPPLYREMGGGGTIPTSGAGGELRLFRLTLEPGASFTPPVSEWTVVGFSGEAQLTNTGIPGDGPLAINADTASGGVHGGAFTNQGQVPAIMWLFGVTPADAADHVGPDGVHFERLGQTALTEFAVDQRLFLDLTISATGPIAQPLFKQVPGFHRSTDVATPGLVYTLQGETSVIDPRGEEVAHVPTGRAVSLPNMIGVSTSGPALDALTPPNVYLSLWAQPQVNATAAINGTPQADGTAIAGDHQSVTVVQYGPGQSPHEVAATPEATPSGPIAPTPVMLTPQPATPAVATGSPSAATAPSAAACDATPRTDDQIKALIARINADPSYIEAAQRGMIGNSARQQAGTGQPADDATVAAVTGLTNAMSVCGQNGDVARATAYWSDEAMLTFLPNLLVGQSDLGFLTDAKPVSTGQPTPMALASVEVFGDGRVGALWYNTDRPAYITFAPTGNANQPWQVDGIDYTIAPLAA